MTFTTWRFSGIQFLATPSGSNVHIVDEHGNNYGSWMDVDRFRAKQQAGIIADWQALGKARLQIILDR